MRYDVDVLSWFVWSQGFTRYRAEHRSCQWMMLLMLIIPSPSLSGTIHRTFFFGPALHSLLTPQPLFPHHPATTYHSRTRSIFESHQNIAEKTVCRHASLPSAALTHVHRPPIMHQLGIATPPELAKPFCPCISGLHISSREKTRCQRTSVTSDGTLHLLRVRHLRLPVKKGPWFAAVL